MASQASLIVELALETPGIELFHTSAPDAYVRVPAEMHHEVWPVRSTTFRRWLSLLYFLNTDGAPGNNALKDALAVLEAEALFKGPEREVHVRLAEHDGAVFLDLADAEWRAVRISAEGWEVVSDPPVRFRRAYGMLPLPEPVRGGPLDLLKPFVNVPAPDWPLLLGWLVGALRPRGPYPVLLVHGEQGSAKSTLVRIVRALVDPNEAPVRKEPRNGQDLIIAARNGHIVAFDNVSRLSQDLSDDLARLATGAGFSARQLFTDLDEVVVQLSRPICVNGIEEVAVRGDLLDRGVILSLPSIGTFRDEDEFWSAFRSAHPLILGALLDAVSMALAQHKTTATPNVRMADFARWVSAAEPALGLDPGIFVAAYQANRAGAVQLTLEANTLAAPVQELALKGGFEGTATELLDRLGNLVSEDVRRQREWPKRANTLTGRLRRVAPALRRVGILVEFDRDANSRTISIGTVATHGENIVTTVIDRHPVTIRDDDDDDDDGSQHDGARFLASLPVAERRVVEELMALLDARFVDDRSADEVEDGRYITPEESS